MKTYGKISLNDAWSAVRPPLYPGIEKRDAGPLRRSTPGGRIAYVAATRANSGCIQRAWWYGIRQTPRIVTIVGTSCPYPIAGQSEPGGTDSSLPLRFEPILRPPDPLSPRAGTPLPRRRLTEGWASRQRDRGMADGFATSTRSRKQMLSTLPGLFGQPDPHIDLGDRLSLCTMPQAFTGPRSTGSPSPQSGGAGWHRSS